MVQLIVAPDELMAVAPTLEITGETGEPIVKLAVAVAPAYDAKIVTHVLDAGAASVMVPVDPLPPIRD